ncbi:hypothetical protein [Cesiribacter sp. SM1]|uniref:hypothetical protein n=1 Tax=Cesiribacter sp. SM1 TaxID=2861196 RepID=UPI001CD4A0C9|nr:hypothetical protein [Cesiribacter sp. SM1]
MSTRKLYTLLVVLGLAMVWLGFLFTYELKIAEHTHTSVEQVAEKNTGNTIQPEDEESQAAGLNSSDAVSEAGLGFPMALAGLGMIFVIGGAFNFRKQNS